MQCRNPVASNDSILLPAFQLAVLRAFEGREAGGHSKLADRTYCMSRSRVPTGTANTAHMFSLHLFLSNSGVTIPLG